MVCKAKGQASIEFLMIVGLILLITTPFIASALGNLATRAHLESSVEKAVNIAQYFETVSNLGPGNGVVIELPDGGIFVEDNNLRIDDIHIPLTPTIDDISILNGEKFGIINTGSVKVVPSPEIVSITIAPVEPGDFVETRTANFDAEYGKVFFDGFEPDVVIIDDPDLQFQVPFGTEPGIYEVYLKMNYNGVELTSGIVYIEVDTVTETLG
jgi:hypothetical protein